MEERSTRMSVIAVVGLLLGFALTMLFGGSDAPPTDAARLPAVSAPPVARGGSEPEPSPVDSKPATTANFAADAPEEDESPWREARVEEFKRALYEIDVDSVDRLEELDAFVALGDTDPRSLWDTDWTGIDDWKEQPDDFRLERTDDGALVFIPGEQTRRQYSFFETLNEYSYDEATGEFIYETDFYGKPITNIVKFLREDVMVLMVVSGQKVDMSIYGPSQGADR